MNIVLAGAGVGIRLQRGEQLRVIDPEGQSGDVSWPDSSIVLRAEMDLAIALTA